MLARALLAMCVAALMVAPAAVADPAAGLTGSGELAVFDTANPAGLTSRPITGLQDPAEKVVGLDWRPSTGELFVITVPAGTVANALIRSYSVDPATGAAT